MDKWNSRQRIDREVTGAIELAYMRGEHNGYLDGRMSAGKAAHEIACMEAIVQDYVEAAERERLL